MVVGARRSGLSISEIVALLGFFHKSVSMVYTEWCKKNSSVGDKALLKSEKNDQTALS